MELLAEKWKVSILYLGFIYSIIFLLHSLVFQKLLLGYEPVRIKRNSDLPLRFRSDGTFKILQVADMHFANGVNTRCRDVMDSEFKYCSDLNTTRFFKRMVDAEKPDFIAFTGDNIFGPSTSDAAESLFRVFGPVIEYQIPWAAILGNHDQESTMTREELMSSFPSWIIQYHRPTHNSATFLQLEIRLYKTSMVLGIMISIGDRAIVQGARTYGWIKESQLQWLRDVSQRFQGTNRDLFPSTDASSQGKPPALTFFHIPIPEVRDLYYKKIVGQFQEGVACSSVNSGVLQNLVAMGDVKAVFMGHDHSNDFCGNLDGIWFCYGGGFGYHGYGRPGWSRRGRVIVAELAKGERSWMGVERIGTWKRLDDEKLTKIDEQILWEREQSAQ
ncbi:putative inactive purple acid phosphatase 28, partial [Cucurbita argyrosperma subsp. sororia]